MSDTTFIQRLRSLADSQQVTASDPLVVDFDASNSRRLLSSPTAWAIVALAAVVIVTSVIVSVLSGPEPPPLAQQRIAALSSTVLSAPASPASPASPGSAAATDSTVSTEPSTVTRQGQRATVSATPGTPSDSAVSSAPGMSGDSGVGGGTASQDEIVVSVVGPVRYPGLVKMPAQARIQHAIDAAGGLVPPGSYEGLNRAQLLADGMQIVVGSFDTAGRIEPGASPESSNAVHSATAISNAGHAVNPSNTDRDMPATTVNLNTATAEQLTELTGVGPKTAAVIIAWRTEHGPFNSVEQLLDVKGIGPAKLARLRPHVTV